MDRRTIFAFIIIIASIFFFQSDFYYNRILGKRSPSQVMAKKQRNIREKQARQMDSLASIRKSRKVDSLAAPTLVPKNGKQFIEPTITQETPQPISLKPVIIESPLYICKIDRRGARIVSWKMKIYKPFGSNDANGAAELIPQNSTGAATLSFSGRNYDSFAFSCMQVDSTDSLINIGADETFTLTFVHTGRNNEKIEKEFKFYGNEWRTGLTVRKYNMGTGKLKIGWSGINAVDKDPKKDNKKRSGPGGYEGYSFMGDEVTQANDFKDNTKEYTGNVRWISIKEGYFGAAIILDTTRYADVEFKRTMEKKSVTQITFAIKEDFNNDELHYEIYAGPLKYSTLKSYGIKLEGTIFQGYRWFVRADKWFPPLCGFVLWLLNFFYRLIPDYGVAIIFLTIISRVVTIPLTLKSQKSMGAMKDLQPKITELKNKYKSDSAKMNAELMKLYRKHGVNPMGMGCLPMFLQMPVFIALFVSLRKAVELRGAGTFLPWISDLSRPDVILHLGFNIPFYGENVCLLPIIMAVATFFQNKMTIKDPNQKMMVYFMPVFFLFMFNSFPAGLNLYWTLSTIIGIIQQVIVDQQKKRRSALQKA